MGSPTLHHLAVFSAVNAGAIVEPGDGGVGHPSHLAFQHSLLRLHHIQVLQWLQEIGHGEALCFCLHLLWFLWDGWHLLQLGAARAHTCSQKEHDAPTLSPGLCTSPFLPRAQGVASRQDAAPGYPQLLHLGGSRWPRLLHVEICRALHMAMCISGSHRVPPLILTAHVHDDQRVQTPILLNPHILPFLHWLACTETHNSISTSTTPSPSCAQALGCSSHGDAEKCPCRALHRPSGFGSYQNGSR